MAPASLLIELLVVSGAAATADFLPALPVADAPLCLAQVDVKRLDRRVAGEKHAPSMTDLSAKVVEGASLDEVGYQKVVAKARKQRASEAMTTFIHSVCKNDGLRIFDPVALHAFVRYFDGECDTQSFAALRAGLHEALRRPATCGGGWVTRVKAPPADTRNVTQAEPTSAFLAFNSDFRSQAAATAVLRTVHAFRTSRNASGAWVGYRAISSRKSDKAMKTFILGTIAALGGEVLNKGDLNGFVHWYSGTAAKQSYHRLVQELREISVKPNAWLRFHAGRSVKKADISQTAKLNEDGYLKVAATKDHDKMALYIHRVAEKMGLHITSLGDVQGMVPWYTAECGPQSYAALRDELIGKVQPGACGGWVVPEQA